MSIFKLHWSVLIEFSFSSVDYENREKEKGENEYEYFVRLIKEYCGEIEELPHYSPGDEIMSLLLNGPSYKGLTIRWDSELINSKYISNELLKNKKALERMFYIHESNHE